jgi:hypothetical protein
MPTDPAALEWLPFVCVLGGLLLGICGYWLLPRHRSRS